MAETPAASQQMSAGPFSIQMSWFVWALLKDAEYQVTVVKAIEIAREWFCCFCSEWVWNGEIETAAALRAEHTQRNLVLCRSRQQDLEPSRKETFRLSPPKYIWLQRYGDGETWRQVFLADEPHHELSREETFRRELKRLACVGDIREFVIRKPTLVIFPKAWTPCTGFLQVNSTSFTLFSLINTSHGRDKYN